MKIAEDEQPCKQCGKDIHITHLNEPEHQFGHHIENMQGPYCNQECWTKGSDYNPKKSNDRAFRTGWDIISKKSWDGLSDDEGWTKNPLQCRNCGKKMTDAEWEQKTCECGTRNTVHPSMR